MKVLFHVHMYPPVHNAGAEWMVKNIADFLLANLCEVRVLSSFDGELDGVKIYNKTPRTKIELFAWADVIITHLGWAGEAFAERNKPIVFLSHNFTRYPIKGRHNILAVYNSEANKRALAYENKTAILRPPVLRKDYQVPLKEENKYITLANLNENKGGRFLIDLAKAMPQFQFLGVEGSYEPQITANGLDNLTYWPNTPNMKDVYAVSKVVIMPSWSESWGRVGVEAMMSGIPVVANNKPKAGGRVVGMLEAYGDGATYAPREDLAAWVTELTRLMEDHEYYLERCQASYQRGTELDELSKSDLKQFYLAMNEFVKGYQKKVSGPEHVQSPDITVRLLKTVAIRGGYPSKRGDVIQVTKTQYENLKRLNACEDV